MFQVFTKAAVILVLNFKEGLEKETDGDKIVKHTFFMLIRQSIFKCGDNDGPLILMLDYDVLDASK